MKSILFNAKFMWLLLIGLCVVPFLAEGKTYNTPLNNVIDVSPSYSAPYNRISTAIAQIPTSGPDAPSITNPVLIRVFPGFYDDNFEIPSFVKVMGMGENPVPAGGTVKVHSSSSLPVVKMQPSSTIEGMTIGWIPGDPTTGTTSFSLIETLVSGANPPDIRRCVIAGQNPPAGLEGIRSRDGYVLEDSKIMDVSTGVYSEKGGAIRETQMFLPNTATGVVSNGLTIIRDSVIMGTNIGIRHNGTGLIEYLSVTNSDIRGETGGAIVIQNASPIGSPPGAIIAGGFLISHYTAIRFTGGGSVLVSNTRVDGEIVKTGSGTLKLIYCFDRYGNPVTYP